jgi:ketosteroid isomerase-like protein
MVKPLLAVVALNVVALAAQNDIEAVRKTARELEQALITADAAALERLLTDDFLRTPPGGRDTNKREYIPLIASGQLKYVAFQNAEEMYRVYENSVLVNDLTDLRYRIAAGPESRMRLKLLWVWVKQDGKWRPAGVQGTQIPSQ